MLSKPDVICQKVVQPREIRLEDIKLLQLSDQTKEVIFNSNVESLKGLLGHDSEEVFRRLLKDYWGLK
jgi:hypothetical protein